MHPDLNPPIIQLYVPYKSIQIQFFVDQIFGTRRTVKIAKLKYLLKTSGYVVGAHKYRGSNCKVNTVPSKATIETWTVFRTYLDHFYTVLASSGKQWKIISNGRGSERACARRVGEGNHGSYSHNSLKATIICSISTRSTLYQR